MKKIALAIAVLAAISTPVFAEDNQSNWIFRGGVAQINPNDDSGTVLGGGVGVDSATGVGLSFTYMFDQHWGLEALGALPFTHDVVGTGPLDGLKVGEVSHLPPTFSVVYQWGDETKYHVGAGLNYTVFFDEKTSSDLNGALGADADLDLDASTGLALSFGLDIPMTGNWNFTANAYYMDIDTTADILVNGAVAASVDVQIDPWVFMVGVSTTF